MSALDSSAFELTAEYRSVFADILSQAVTGELIGMQNFASMVGMVDSVDEKIEAVEHAENEKCHALAFRQAAVDLGVDLIVDVDAPYWKRIRMTFLDRVEQGDLTACLLIQEIMLESFAVSTYETVADVAHASLAKTFRAIATEEQEHLEHALEFLRGEYLHAPDEFERKVEQVHEDVMTVLAEMVAREDPRGHCGLCRTECAKKSLRHVNLEIGTLRGRALNHYLKVLDRLGLPGEKTLKWVANLPV